VNSAELEELVNNVDIPLVLSLDPATSERSYNCKLSGQHHSWNVCLFFPLNFPYCLPKAVLLDTSIIGKIPHVNSRGVICMEDTESLFIDYKRPADIIEFFVKNLVKFLDRISLGIYQNELLNELEGYYSPEVSVNSFYQAGVKPELIYLHSMYSKGEKRPEKSIPVAITAKQNSLPKNFSNAIKIAETPFTKILHLPLEFAAMPPENGADFDSKYFSSLVKLSLASHESKIASLAQKCRDFNVFYVLLTMPRTSGERTQLLLRFTANKHLKHPVLEHSDDWDINLFAITHHSKKYLLERGGAEVNLHSKRVGIVGCGSVGSQICNMLAKTGIGEFVLIDSDLFESDNIYRNHLGGSDLNFAPDAKTGAVQKWSKVSLLAYELKKQLPYIQIFDKYSSLADVLSDKDLKLCDIIIVAVGEPATNLQINKDLKDHGFENLIFCWNEAAGIGGHSVLINYAHTCYQCLYTEDEYLEAENQFTLLKVGQPVSKNLTGCGGSFTPFSFIDSNKTAELAATQATQYLLEGLDSQIASWKGQNRSHLKTTIRYSSMPLKEEIMLLPNLKCEICHGK